MTSAHEHHDHAGHDHAGHHHSDPTLYRSPAEAMAAPREPLGYVALLDPDAIAVVTHRPATTFHTRK